MMVQFLATMIHFLMALVEMLDAFEAWKLKILCQSGSTALLIAL